MQVLLVLLQPVVQLTSHSALEQWDKQQTNIGQLFSEVTLEIVHMVSLRYSFLLVPVIITYMGLQTCWQRSEFLDKSASSPPSSGSHHQPTRHWSASSCGGL